jgi:hypothetical protein
MTGQGSGFVGGSFHQVAIAAKSINEMIDNRKTGFIKP